MKIYGMVVCLIFGVPVWAAAQPPAVFSRYVPSDGTEEVLSFSNINAGLQQAWQRSAQKSDAHTQSKRTGNSLSELQKAYPEQQALVASLQNTHQRLTRLLGAVQMPGAAVSQELTELYRHFSALYRAQPEVAEQAQRMLNHRYWVEEYNKSVNLAELSLQVRQTCAVRACPVEGMKWFARMHAQ